MPGAPPELKRAPTRVLDPERWLLVGLVIVICHLAWQLRGILNPAFLNKDVAGIVYNARLILAGGLPYVDSEELKPPGAFFLFSTILPLGGLRAIWLISLIWGVLTSFACGWFASGCFDVKTAKRAAVLHAAAAPLASLGDINYSLWMMLPFTLAAATAVHGARSSGKRALGFWAATGALAAFAALIKPTASSLVFLLVPLVLFGAFHTGLKGTLKAILAGSLGAAVVVALTCLPYAWNGELPGLLSGLGKVQTFGKEYVTVVREGAQGTLPAVREGLLCLGTEIPSLLIMGLLGLLPGRLSRVNAAPSSLESRLLGLVPWVFLIGSLVGLSATLRFYAHDNVQLWPALAVIAVRPRGLFARLIDWVGKERTAIYVPLAVGVGTVLLRLDGLVGLQNYFIEKDLSVRQLCEELRPGMEQDDSVMAWGWHAWSVYEYCGRKAPSGHYKDMGFLTTVNTNTCNHGYGPIRLKTEAATSFLQELEARPPALILWSDYYATMGGDPLDDWNGANLFLDSEYEIASTKPGFIAYVRRDVAARLQRPKEPVHAARLREPTRVPTTGYCGPGVAPDTEASTSNAEASSIPPPGNVSETVPARGEEPVSGAVLPAALLLSE
jgi:hypothetical protein